MTDTRPLDQLTQTELRALAVETVDGKHDPVGLAFGTFLATLAITAPKYTPMNEPVVVGYRGVEPDRVSAARGDAAMHAGQDLIDADDLARHPVVPPAPNVDSTIYRDPFDKK